MHQPERQRRPPEHQQDPHENRTNDQLPENQTELPVSGADRAASHGIGSTLFGGEFNLGKQLGITVLPDPKFHDLQIAKFINMIMCNGKKPAPIPTWPV